MTVLNFPYHVELVHVLMFFLTLVFGIQVYYYVRYYLGIAREHHRQNKGKTHFTAELPPVSVIICSRNESRNLKEFLPSVLEQDYPNFEVIVVNDGSTDETNEALALFKQQYANLYDTYVPELAEVISRKKLAITIGVKAAKNDLLLFTDADCQAVGNHWISSVVKNFTPEVDVVLGYGGYFQRKGFLSHMISYDTLFIAMQYMGFAAAGHPYMGVGRNLAYRKDLFMKHKGFAGMLHLQSGDDDLFVNAVSNKGNTRIEISSESITRSVPKTTFRQWFLQHERHLSTACRYKKDTLNRLGVEVVSRGLFYALFIAVLCMWQLVPGFIAIVFFASRYALQAVSVNLSAKILNERKLFLSIPLFDIILPLFNLSIFIHQLFFQKRGHRYRWK